MPDIVSRISKNLNCLTDAQKNVANYFLYHLDKVAFGTVEDMSHIIGVSSATIIRFSQAIGYAGFSELQKDAQMKVLNGNTEENLSAKQNGMQDMLEDSFELDKKNLLATLKNINRDDLEKACQLLCRAKRIHILGMRVCRTLSTYAYINWGQLRADVCLIHNDSADFPEEITSIQPEDVIIAFWARRYNTLTGNILEYARKKGIKSILISDPLFYASKIYSDISLHCQMQSPSYQNSFVAPIALINYITRRMESFYGIHAAERLSEIDELLGPDFYMIK